MRDLLQQISNDANLPALGGTVSRVVQLASSGDEGVRNLAYFILSDVALTQKILRLANTVCYRTASGTPVTTISKAIFLLGFETVKTSALAMLLVDTMSGKHVQSVQTELSYALAASIVGQEMVRRSQFKDAEEASVAALFRNIGRLLIAAHDHKLYANIQELIEKGIQPGYASTQVLGCSFDMLGEAVLQEWGIPDSIVQGVKPLPAGELKTAKTKQEWVQQVAEFSTAVAVEIAHADGHDHTAAIKKLLARFGSALHLDESKLGQLIETVKRESSALSISAKLGSLFEEKKTGDASSSSPPSSSISMEQGLPAEFLLAGADPGPLRIDARHASGKPVNARDLLLAGVQDVTEMLTSGRCKVNDLILSVLEILYRSLGFRFATVCLKDAKSNQFRARIALGENHFARQSSFMFSAERAQDLFHLAMENNADLLISDATDPKIANLLPAWHRTLLPDARSFIVLPLAVQKKPLGFFYADRVQAAPEGVPPDETALIRTLKGQVLGALTVR